MPAIRGLLKKHGVNGELTIKKLTGGRNNRVWQVKANGMKWIVKQYFNDPEDTRERQRAEYVFSRYMWDMGSTQVPCPFIYEEETGMTLFEYIPGNKIFPVEVCPQYLLQVIDFVQVMNHEKYRGQAMYLPAASESCFSLSEHIHCIEIRIKRLEFVDKETALGGEVKRFIQTTLVPCWEERKHKVESSLSPSVFYKTLNVSERCVSPSDLGFHNALLEESGKLKFIDFEYAGWDDPAKLSCDFFCQPEIPVPVEWFELFVQGITDRLPNSGEHLNRAKMLFPLYRIKWACILLNEFLLVGARRRAFAQSNVDNENGKYEQFLKAQQIIEPIRSQSDMPESVGNSYNVKGACL